MYLQTAFPEFSVDAEYNRHGGDTKKLGLPRAVQTSGTNTEMPASFQT